ncbi:putative K domain-like, alpha/beta, ribosome-binding factor A domain superfamily [Plasmopara halstedii]
MFYRCLTVQITLLFYNASLDHSDRPVRVVLWSEILSCLCSHHRISEFHRRHVFKVDFYVFCENSQHSRETLQQYKEKLLQILTLCVSTTTLNLSVLYAALRATTMLQFAHLLIRHSNHIGTNLRWRYFHASVMVLARRNRKGSPGRSSSTPATIMQGGETNDTEFSHWYNETLKQYQSKVLLPPGMIELSNSMELYDDEEVDHDESDQHDEEAEKFLDEAEELFRLNPSDFQKRMDSYNQRHAHEDDDSDDDIDHKVDRAKELIPKEKLAKVMRELNPNSTPTGKNAERMPSTNPRKKNLVHLEKKEKPSRAERTTYRQESVGIAVLEYVQTLLVEDADLSGANIVPTFVEANVSPDLRKIVLFWEPVRLNSEDQIIGKKKAEALKNRLQRQERWVRRNVTQHLNLKYSPVIQFKEQKEAKAEKAQTLFEAEMKWLDNV